MLHRKKGQQRAIDCERRSERRLQLAVEPSRHGKAADERDRIEKRREKDQIRHDTVAEEQQPLGHCTPSCMQ